MFPFNFFPFNSKSNKMMNGMNPEQMQQFTQDMMGKMMSKHMEGMSSPFDMMKGIFPDNHFQAATTTQLNYSVFDTHEYVFVRITISNEEWLKTMKIYHTANQISVEHVPNLDDKHSLTLPAIVKKKGATANYKDGILEIKIPKIVELQYSEIDVTELF
ncbi:Hsp20/alpha crystallin family protein [Bacillus sp. DNRA2]|uniref:Hsp20/alpha crystallin family protein n=1 Tax=Bacillus sp. DNRA2 TaxID=2723053 RepID=UPI00145F3C8F|nr:Hsp20/alpha crystallin family protein [Bacillus sp. DNRA2]NMD69995.1 Hsp20/alpha crystallin family protein [Bacillus sp. DNRA2]